VVDVINKVLPILRRLLTKTSAAEIEELETQKNEDDS
jgi:hypothetical protein